MNYINCRDISSMSVSTADTNIDCRDDFYKNEVLPVNLIMVIILGLLIPVLIGISLIKNHRNNKL